MPVYATPHATIALFVKAVLTPDVRMKPRPICVPAETHVSKKPPDSSIDRTSGTPSLGCPAGRPVASSAIGRCSGNEMRAIVC
jgi:hypothetical protein